VVLVVSPGDRIGVAGEYVVDLDWPKSKMPMKRDVEPAANAHRKWVLRGSDAEGAVVIDNRPR